MSQTLARDQHPAPGPPGLPLLGSVVALHRMGQVPFYTENWRSYGDVVRFRLGPFVAHILAHPDHIHQVLATNAANYTKGPSYDKVKHFLGSGLLTSEGAPWRRQRRLMQPAFTHRAAAAFGDEMVAAIETMLAAWAGAAAVGTPLVINREMGALTLAIIGRTIFSTDFGRDVHTILAGAADATTVLNQRLATFIDLPHFLPTPANRRFKHALHQFDTFVARLIAARRREGSARHDLLDRLLAARDEDDGSAMSDQQIRDEIVTLLFAGHETTAVALTWTFYLLAQHPEVEAQLHAEVAAVLGGRPPTVADIPALTFTRLVADEAMRLYPPVWTFPRAATDADEIGGYTIPAGSLIFPTQFLTHRHPDFWEEPARFDPERFRPERAAQRHRYAYYPFGGGPRTCIGIHFALVEIVLTIAAIVQRYRLHHRPGPPIAPKSIVTLHPARDVMMTLEVR